MWIAIAWLAAASGCASILDIEDPDGDADGVREPTERCEDLAGPVAVVPDGDVLVINGDTSQARNDEGTSCGSSNQRDHVFQVFVPDGVQFQYTLTPDGWTAALDIRAGDSCDRSQSVECRVVGEMFTDSRRPDRDINYFVVLDGAGFGDQSGPYTLTFELNR